MRSTIYTTNAKRAEYNDQTPTMADQSQAHDTDINIIVGRYGIGGTVQGIMKTPLEGDLSELPTDLRGMIEKARELDILRKKLPPEYQHLSTQELLNTQPSKLLELTKNAETIRERRSKLPERFKRTSDGDLLALTPDEFNSIITPVQPSTEPKAESK